MKEECFVHASAIIDDTAKIGKGTKIWINSQVRENVLIGENCIISKDTYIDHDVKIGNRVKIQNSVSVYTGVTIDDDVFIGPNVAFTNDMYPRAFNIDWCVTNTRISKGASIGANATIVCGIRIGKYAMIGAGSVVTKDVGSYELVVGNPAKKIGYVCKCGSRLNDSKVCQTCGLDLGEAIK